jgi:hypothetical protein
VSKLYSWVDKKSVDLENWKKNDWTYTWNKIASNKAFWVFEEKSDYKPAKNIMKNRILLVFDIGEKLVSVIKNKDNQIDFESDKFKGETKHENQIIVKSNEKGAYGIGKMVRESLKVKISLASKEEVAAALGLKPIEVPKKQTW